MYGTPQLGRFGNGTYSTLTPRSRRRRRALTGLGQELTATQAVQQVFGTVSSKAGFTQGDFNAMVAATQAGAFTNFNPAGCSGTASKSVGPAITSTAGGVALSISPLTGPAAPFVAAAGAAIDVAGAIWGAIFGAHSQAVAKEQQVECAAVPAANDSIQAINQAVQNGTFTPAEGIAALQSLQSNFVTAIASITKNSPSQCNAGCIWTKTMQAIVLELSSQYQALQQQQTAAAATAASQQAAAANAGAASSGSSSSAGINLSSLPSWLLPVAALALLWELF